MKAKKTILTGALLTILACSSFSNTFADTSINSESGATDANFFIDASIQGNARTVIQNVMKTLDPDARENVIYQDSNGKFYANKPELLDNVFEFKKVSDNVFETPDGKERFAFPVEDDSDLKALIKNSQNSSDSSTSTNNQQPSGDLDILATQPSCSGTTGPFRRVTSLANYSWESSYVYLPKKPNIQDHNTKGTTDYNGDTGYAYMGGLGVSGGSVDAGLMHSTLYDNWAMMISVDNDPLGYTQRFQSGQNVNIKFNVPSNNNVSLTVSGIDYTTKKNTTVTFTRAAKGFTLNGANILKRLTTIGQDPENLNSGSYMHGVHWYNSLIGNSSTSYHTWAAADTYGSPCTHTTAVVSVNYVNAGEETVDIDL
jgi:hypothetical protein